MTADELVEKVAWAIIHAQTPLEQARAAIRAVHEAMREPTTQMMDAGDACNRLAAAALWRAMLAAHPIAEVARDE